MSTIQLSSRLRAYKKEVKQELDNILDYWLQYAPDNINGGFIGKIDNDNVGDYTAPKGAVLNARILWSFSAAYNLEAKEVYLEAAGRAYNYIQEHLIDEEFGGVFWTVNAEGKLLNTKKQVYAIAFTIYGLSEYYIASKNEDAKSKAIQLYELLVDKAFDRRQTGYFEAFTREWDELPDLRLSLKDANEKKTMNTHLHVLEAYTTLYLVWRNEGLKRQIQLLIRNFLDHIIDPETRHLVLFLDENWTKKSDIISYGHDIEAAWLLLEAAEAIEDQDLILKVRNASIALTQAAAEGFDLEVKGGLYYEFAPSDHHLITEKHWWVQAEAMVGFFNAYQLSGNEFFLNRSLKVWDFIKNSILDKENGEWTWGVLDDGSVMMNQDKVGLWKCPYHNSRACIEIIKRATAMEETVKNVNQIMN
ncbi:AGE family epimerase/isomerase [Pedobacter sp. SYSU D00535]|uniref:AGE family epimerase/isomerase n=1 Tax=Pedobacter sp. SYSU D00535 TaxID=2810308 RepID=UPI001A97A504|nr:AGE family epimerase/isomerase [Pedobacter sp. SYSU D00535]